tara:strand:+ start:7445 stop:7645 length:201 start_codon:yes stop_codon:yes gene_type:complete
MRIRALSSGQYLLEKQPVNFEQPGQLVKKKSLGKMKFNYKQHSHRSQKVKDRHYRNIIISFHNIFV